MHKPSDAQIGEMIDTLIDELIAERHRQGMTQRDLADASHTPQSAIARLESKETTPRLNTIINLLVPLGKTLAIVDLKE